MSNIRAIFFDMGDTLIFDTPLMPERVRMALRQAEIAYHEEKFPAAFRVAEDYALSQYLTGVPFDDAQLQEACGAMILRELDLPALDSADQIKLSTIYRGISYGSSLHPGAIALIEELKQRGFIVGAISDWEETLPMLLEELKLAPHLDAMAVSAIVGVTKPNVVLFEEALRQAGVAPEEALHIGDYYELDVVGAREAGMTPVLFDWKDRMPGADCKRLTTFEEVADFCLNLPPPGSGA